ncbi:Anthocyanidin reductase ((2S)-flavan-3-ol-forming) [Linum perenne]
MATTGKKVACVIGGTGFVASRLVKLLLENGYSVRTTVRNPDNERRISHLVALKELGELEIFAADLTDEASFDAPVAGSDLVFHVATPVHFASQDPENDMIKPAIQGVENVLKACARAKTVKRVVLTSSAAAVTINNVKETGLVMDEKDWTDVEFLTSEKPPTWDVCRAHLFVAEKQSASDRYICCAANTSVAELAKFLSLRYPQYKSQAQIGDVRTKTKLTISSKKLIGEGFSFKHGLEEIYDDTVEYFEAVGILK